MRPDRHPIRVSLRLLGPLCTSALLLVAVPSALADTRVSIENGSFGAFDPSFGPQLQGRVVTVRDAGGNAAMDVAPVRANGQIRVRDINGDTVADAGCEDVGADAMCADQGVVGLFFEGSNFSDQLENDTNLPAAFSPQGGNDEVTGGPVHDAVEASEGNDTAAGGDGADLFDGAGAGADVFDGQGSGVDAVTYSGFGAPVTVTLDDAPGDADGDNVRGSVEAVFGTPFGDALAGSDADNLLSGEDGDDVLLGGNGNDVLDGEAGGDDMSGGGGIDTSFYAFRDAGVRVTLDERPNDGNAEDRIADNVRRDVERVIGTRFDDTLADSDVLPRVAVDNELVGGAGDDTLVARFGSDELSGGAGDDQIDGGASSDLIRGGPGRDRVSYARRTEPVTVSLADGGPPANGGASDDSQGLRDALQGIENATTGSGDDKVVGGFAANAIATGAGRDSLTGNAGNDELDPGPGALETVRGGAGNDLLLTNDGEKDAPISCGESLRDADEIEGDLQDAGDAAGQFQLTDCETVQLTPKDVPAGAVIRSARLRITRRGRARVRLRCAVRVRCRGTLLLSVSHTPRDDLSARAPLARRRYSLRAGRGRRVTLRLSKGEARRLKRRGIVYAFARELARDSRPKLTIRELEVRS
jgi:Ca2+-binding RTX toxin-like protein